MEEIQDAKDAEPSLKNPNKFDAKYYHLTNIERTTFVCIVTILP